jgi:hypothetical protein
MVKRMPGFRRCPGLFFPQLAPLIEVAIRGAFRQASLIGYRVADFAFLCSSKSPLHRPTHSLQIYTRLEWSGGFEMSVSTWSWVLLQNEHLRISSSSRPRRLLNINRVWPGSSRSQRSQKFTLALLIG